MMMWEEHQNSIVVKIHVDHFLIDVLNNWQNGCLSSQLMMSLMVQCLAYHGIPWWPSLPALNVYKDSVRLLSLGRCNTNSINDNILDISWYIDFVRLKLFDEWRQTMLTITQNNIQNKHMFGDIQVCPHSWIWSKISLNMQNSSALIWLLQ